MDVYVVFAAHNTRAHAAADAIVSHAHAHGHRAVARTLEDADNGEVIASDALVVGCSARVDTPFGGRQAQRAGAWAGGLPDLAGKPTVVFCTFGFFPHTFADVTTRTAEVLDGLERQVEHRGGMVIGSASILNRRIEAGAASVIEVLTNHLAA